MMRALEKQRVQEDYREIISDMYMKAYKQGLLQMKWENTLR
mgnify:CR=1 FL=1